MHKAASNLNIVGDRQDIPPELLFKHVGHRGEVKDFQWNMNDPWTILSVSSDEDGGSLQIQRMNDLIYRPREEVLKELEENRNKLTPQQL
jgi:histone-binding protein RBBP4